MFKFGYKGNWYINLLILLALQTPCIASVLAKSVIHNGKIESVGIDDSVAKIFAIFGSRYQLRDIKEPQTVRKIQLFHKGKVIVSFPMDSNGKILGIYVYGHYVTEENIGVGSKLSELIKAYGKGKITPTDPGYFVNFETLKGIAFLLNDEDIPKGLRGIPDDIFTIEDEKKILRLGEARVSAIKIWGQYD